MAASGAERQRKYRNLKRGGPARQPQPCPSPAAYRRHVRVGEDPCPGCRLAYNQSKNKERAARLAKAAAAEQEGAG